MSLQEQRHAGGVVGQQRTDVLADAAHHLPRYLRVRWVLLQHLGQPVDTERFPRDIPGVQRPVGQEQDQVPQMQWQVLKTVRRLVGHPNGASATMLVRWIPSRQISGGGVPALTMVVTPVCRSCSST